MTQLLSPGPLPLAPTARKWIQRAGLALVFVLTLGIGLFRIGVPAPWVDEAVTVMVVRRPWAGILPLLQGADAPLVPYYLLAKVWTAGLFWLPTLVAVRALSAVAAAITVAALFLLVARISGMRAGLIAALLLTSLAGFSRYAQEARPYALLVMTATLSWLAWDAWRRPELPALRRPGTWLGELGRVAGYLLSLIGSVLFHLFGLFQWPAQILADLATPGATGRRRLQRALTTGGAMVLTAALVAVPLISAALHGTGAPRLVRMTLPQLYEDFSLTLNATRTLVPALVLLGFAVVAVVAVVARAATARKYARLVWIGVIWSVVPMVLSIGAAVVRPALLRARYWMPVVVPLSALAAVGLLIVWEWVWRAVSARMGGSATGGARATSVAAAVLVVPLLAQCILQVQGQLTIRASGGHAVSLKPALAEVDAILESEPDLPVTTTPNTRTTIVWAMRPELIEGDVLFRLDETATSVWPVARDAAEVQKLLEGRDRILWVRARIAAAGTTPTPRPTVAPKALQALGFEVASAERHGSWWICTLER